MDGRGQPETLRRYYMEKDRFALSWIKMREKYDSRSRSDLLQKQYKIDKSFFKKIIDLGSGNGSFLRFCHTKKLIFNEMLLLDHDIKLLRNFYSTTCSHLKESRYRLLKESPTKYLLKNIGVTKTRNIDLVNVDILKSLDIINQYNIISLSAMSDILPPSFIKKLLSHVSKNKIIYFSICFNGKVDWNIKHKYDKYILTMFNKNQETNKGSGYVIGCKSIKLIKEYSIKNKHNIMIKDSSWKINSYNEGDKIFQKMYLDTLYRPLKKDSVTNKDMLFEWKEAKLKKIISGRSKIIVGHKDILIKT